MFNLFKKSQSSSTDLVLMFKGYKRQKVTFLAALKRDLNSRKKLIPKRNSSIDYGEELKNLRNLYEVQLASVQILIQNIDYFVKESPSKDSLIGLGVSGSFVEKIDSLSKEFRSFFGGVDFVDAYLPYQETLYERTIEYIDNCIRDLESIDGKELYDTLLEVAREEAAYYRQYLAPHVTRYNHLWDQFVILAKDKEFARISILINQFISNGIESVSDLIKNLYEKYGGLVPTVAIVSLLTCFYFIGIGPTLGTIIAGVTGLIGVDALVQKTINKKVQALRQAL